MKRPLFRDPFGFLTPIVAKHLKMKGDPFMIFFFRKNSHNAEKTEGGPFETFQHPFCGRTLKN